MKITYTRKELEQLLWRELCRATPDFESVPAGFQVHFDYDAEGWVDSVTVMGYNPNPHQPKEQDA